MKQIFLFIALVSSFSNQELFCQETRKFKIDEEYLQNYERRKGGPTRRGFYLQYIGRFELDPTKINRFGSNVKNEHVVTAEGVPEILGEIEFIGDTMIYHSPEDIVVKTSEDSIVTAYYLKLNKRGQSATLKHESFEWRIETFAGKKILRLLDRASEAVEEFKGFERFGPTADFIFEGKFQYFDVPKNVGVPSILGFEEQATFVGTVQFEYQGQPYALDVGRNGFIMFGDETNGEETYGGGRYMRISEPAPDGSVIIDFNYAMNPPCSFSDYTTCLLPPAQNRLPIKILAGEKSQKL